MYRLIFFIKFGRFLAIVHSKILYCTFLSPLSFWDSRYVCIDLFDGVPQAAETLLILLIFLNFCFSDWIISVDLSSNSLILFSDSSNLRLSPSSEFFISVVVCFNSRILLFIISVSLLIVSIFKNSFLYFHLAL